MYYCNLDNDECVIENGGCQHICTNTDGSFSCGCNAGYVLNEDLLNCQGKPT